MQYSVLRIPHPYEASSVSAGLSLAASYSQLLRFWSWPWFYEAIGRSAWQRGHFYGAYSHDVRSLLGAKFCTDKIVFSSYSLTDK